jgi:hypothetical protein
LVALVYRQPQSRCSAIALNTVHLLAGLLPVVPLAAPRPQQNVDITGRDHPRLLAGRVIEIGPSVAGERPWRSAIS